MKAQITKAEPPPKTIVLPRDAFAHDYLKRPAEDEVCVGLRFISAEDEQIARNVAIEKTIKVLAPKGKLLDKQAFDESYNDWVLIVLVARGTCDANDITLGVPWWPLAEDILPRALTSQGIRRVWDEICLMHVTSGVAMPQATDDDIHKLVKLLHRGKALQSASPAIRLETRKCVAYLLEQLTSLDEGWDEPWEPEAIDDEEPEAHDEDDGIERFEVGA